jgi:hypothetical protein
MAKDRPTAQSPCEIFRDTGNWQGVVTFRTRVLECVPAARGGVGGGGDEKSIIPKGKPARQGSGLREKGFTSRFSRSSKMNLAARLNRLLKLEEMLSQSVFRK